MVRLHRVIRAVLMAPGVTSQMQTVKFAALIFDISLVGMQAQV
jgi:hypothetical protein